MLSLFKETSDSGKGQADLEVEVAYGTVELSADHPDADFRIHFYCGKDQLDRLIVALQKAREELTK